MLSHSGLHPGPFECYVTSLWVFIKSYVEYWYICWFGRLSHSLCSGHKSRPASGGCGSMPVSFSKSLHGCLDLSCLSAAQWPAWDPGGSLSLSSVLKDFFSCHLGSDPHTHCLGISPEISQAPPSLQILDSFWFSEAPLYGSMAKTLRLYLPCCAIHFFQWVLPGAKRWEHEERIKAKGGYPTLLGP